MTYILEPYDDALREILKSGVRKKNRTGVDAITIFGLQRRYDIETNFPLLTKRKVWPKSIFAELLWMLSGSTNVNDLEALGSKIWTPWRDPEFEKKHGYVEGALGPVYGFQLRHFGGNYGSGNMKPITFDDGDGPMTYKPYGRGGFDQISFMMKELKENPDSRRIIFSMWNPKQMDGMRLPPCHYTFQLFVYDGKLSGHLTQRSCDFPVGGPANIQFYSTLIYMFAQQAGYTPWQFVHTTVDSHIYTDQVAAVEEYLARPKGDSPKLNLYKAADILSYKPEDFEVVDYNPQPPIKIPVAV
jgi:thymidylate synthase